MNAAICSRSTGSLGLYVVALVPLVSPEKKASAIEQKKMLLEGTSVNGREIICPPHVPVSARNWVDAAVMIAISAASATLLLQSRQSKPLILGSSHQDADHAKSKQETERSLEPRQLICPGERDPEVEPFATDSVWTRACSS